jgi:hypothetical protein
MRYHFINDLEVAVDSSVPMAIVRTFTDATIWGSRGDHS